MALPGYLSLGWPEPSRGKAVELSCEQVPKPSALWSHLQFITSCMSPQHRSLGMALPSLPAPHPARGRGRVALSRQRWEEGLNNCCLSVCLLFL